jgi:arabinofuranan 3-O-arabinosyltransferase
VARIRITTDRGSVEHDVAEQPGPHVFAVLGGPSAQVRVTVLAMRGGREDGNVAIRELTIPGVAPSRMLRVPADVGSTRPPVLAFSRGTQPRAACFTGASGDTLGTLRCDGALARVGEEPLGVDRRFRLAQPAVYGLSGTVLPRLGPQPWLAPSGLVVAASSQLGGDPAVSARFAFDRDPATSWVADRTDPAPAITLRWPGARTLDRLSVRTSALGAANPPLAADLHAVDASGTDQVRRLTLPAGAASSGGLVSFEPLVTDNLRIELQSADQLPLVDGDHDRQASVGLAELRIPALDDLLPAASGSAAAGSAAAGRSAAGLDAVAGAGCGFGPQIEVDGKRYDTSVLGSQANVQGYQRLRLLPCGSLDNDGLPLQPGDHRVRALPTDSFVVHDLTLTPLTPGLPPAPRPRTLQIYTWDAAHRTLQVGDGPDAYLVVPENANPGWVARLGSVMLASARVDGWRQAWLIPAGRGGMVTLSFEPDQPYRIGLLAGAVFVLALLAAALLPAWRHRGPPPRPTPTRSWWGSALAVLALLLLLGGPAPAIALLACLLLRRLRSTVLPAVLATGVLAATGIAVAGRLLGHGQAWAFGPWAQAAVLVAVSAAVAVSLYPAPTAPQHGQAPAALGYRHDR